MSLDIDVTNEELGISLEMNWLRNPYGLCNWVQDNHNYLRRDQPMPPYEQTLHYAINHWNYGDSPQVDRGLFLDRVMFYGETIMSLQTGYFFFNANSLLQHIVPHIDRIPTEAKWGEPRIQGMVVWDDKVGIPVENLRASCFHLGSPSLEYYQNWYRELIAFAELLQHPASVYYCSN